MFSAQISSTDTDCIVPIILPCEKKIHVREQQNLAYLQKNKIEKKLFNGCI